MTDADAPTEPDPAADPADGPVAAADPVRPGWARRRPEWQTTVGAAIVAVAMLAPLRALLRYQGPPMEEGFMLVFPERLLHGDLPHKDFLHLYGPGSLWVLAGWFKAFGVSITAERVFGFGQLAAIVFGVMALARPWGRRVMVASGILGVLLTMTAIGLTALAWDGAVAFLVASVWVGLRARRWLTASEGAAGPDAERRAARLLTLAGVLAGWALLFRPDVIVATTLGTLAILAGLGWGRWRRWLLGAVPVLSLYLVHLALSGPGNAIRGMLFEPVFDLRAGRSLPRPPSWDHFDGALAGVAALRPQPWPLPALASPHQAYLWFFLLPAVTLGIVALGWWRVRTERTAWRPRVLLTVGLVGLGLLPQAFQRPDTTHLAWVSCVTLAFLPAAIAEALEVVRARPIGLPRLAGTWAAGLVALLPLVVLPHFTARTYVDLVKQSANGKVFGYPVTYDGRTFYLGAQDIAVVAQRMLDEVGPQTKPGEKLFVGTADLRKTPYSDAYLYYLLPDLPPGTRYIEMDPGMANAPDSGLAHEVATSDWLILSHVWDAWDEPNDSRVFGPDEPNRVVQRDFCKVGDYGKPDPAGGPETVYFEVYHRCR
jgi:hypothetical protein